MIKKQQLNQNKQKNFSKQQQKYFKRLPFFQNYKCKRLQNQQKEKKQIQIQIFKLILILKNQKNCEVIAYILNFCCHLSISSQQKRMQIMHSIKQELLSPSLDLTFIQNAPNIYLRQSKDQKYSMRNKNAIKRKTDFQKQHQNQQHSGIIMINSNQHLKMLILQVFDKLLQNQSSQLGNFSYSFDKMLQLLKNTEIILLTIFIRSVLYLIFQIDEALWYDIPIKKQILVFLDRIFYPKNDSKRSSRIKYQNNPESQDKIIQDLPQSQTQIFMVQPQYKQLKNNKQVSQKNSQLIVLAKIICQKAKF